MARAWGGRSSRGSAAIARKKTKKVNARKYGSRQISVSRKARAINIAMFARAERDLSAIGVTNFSGLGAYARIHHTVRRKAVKGMTAQAIKFCSLGPVKPKNRNRIIRRASVTIR